MPPNNTAAKDLTPEEVRALLSDAGWSIRALALHHGVSPTVMRQALYMPYPRMEQRIAAALRRSPASIWPSRYAQDGTPANRAARRYIPPRIPPRRAA